MESSCSRDPWRVSSSHDIWGSFQVFPTWHFFTLKIIQLRMPLGDCTAIFFSSPAFTMVLSFIILKWVGLNFKTFLHGQWSSGITAGWYASLLHLLYWLGYQDVVLESRVLNLRLRCWCYLGLPLSSPVFPCPLAMFLSTTWSGTLQKMTGVTLVRCSAKMCSIFKY